MRETNATLNAEDDAFSIFCRIISTCAHSLLALPQAPVPNSRAVSPSSAAAPCGGATSRANPRAPLPPQT